MKWHDIASKHMETNMNSEIIKHPTLKEDEFKHAVLKACSDLSLQFGYEDGLRRAIDVLLNWEEDLLVAQLQGDDAYAGQ
jgi:hypothetical protein